MNFLFQDPPANKNLQTDEADILARTLYGEARGEGVKGIEAVACVILNRVKMADNNNGHFWWGNDIASVCRKPYQFSCWNKNDPNVEKIKNVDQNNQIFTVCTRVARRAVAGVLRDFTEGATHYHALNIAPRWADGQVPLFILGNHVFYKLGA